MEYLDEISNDPVPLGFQPPKVGGVPSLKNNPKPVITSTEKCRRRLALFRFDPSQCARDNDLASKRTRKMKLQLLFSKAFVISLLPVAANAQVTINMGALTCAQYLAMSPSMSRDFSAWMSGWSAYQVRRTYVDLVAHQRNIESMKSWCQLRPQASVMDALKSEIGPQ